MSPEALKSHVAKKSSFAGDVTKLVSGTAFAQAVSLLAAPIIAHLYAPEAWGVLAIFTSITGILGVIACLRYELAIMLPEKDEEAINLLGVSLVFAILIALLTMPIIYWGRGPILRWLNAPGLELYLWLVPVMIFIHGVFLGLNYWNSRTRHFGRLSIARVASSLTTTIGKLGFGYGGYATAGTMIGATVAGQAFATTVLGGQTWRDDRKLFYKSIRWREILTGIKRYKKFPIYSSWSGLLNTTSWQLPVLMLGAFFTPTIVGFYALGFRILQIPMSLIGSAIGQVFHQRAAEAKMQGTLAPLVEGLIKRLLTICLFPMLMLTIIGRDLYIIVFGETWAEAGVYTQILSIWALVWFISSPLSTLYGVLEKQEQGLFLQLLIFITRILSIGIGAYCGSARLALLLFSVSGIIAYGYLVYKILRFSGASLHTIMSGLSKCSLMSFLLLLIILTTKIASEMPIFIVSIGIICTIPYYIVLRNDIVLGEKVHNE